MCLIARLMIVTTILIFISNSSHAQDYSVTPFFGYRFGSSFDSEDDVQVKLDDHSAYGIAFAWPHSPNKEGEILLSHSEQPLSALYQGTEILADTEVTYLHFGGKIWFNNSPVDTSVSAGIGMSHFNSQQQGFDSKTTWSMHLGLGSKYDLTSNLALRADARLFGSFFNSDHQIYCVNGQCIAKLRSEVYLQTEVAIGLQYSF